MSKLKSYLTPNQVAELLMVSPTTLRQWAESGELKALITPGGHRRFMPSDVDKFARKRGLTLNSGDKKLMRILIIDDDIQLLRYLVDLLKDFEDEVITEAVSDSFQAGMKVGEFKPDIILLDLMMSNLDGFEVCKAVKADEKTEAIRVIAMTGYRSEENVEKILSLGAEACLSKPIEENELFKQLGLTV